MTALSVKNKLEFVLDTHPCPSKDHPTYAAWNHYNNMVVSWLVHLISVPIRKSIIWMDLAVDVWNDLKTRYSRGNLSRISDMQMEAATLCQGDQSVTDYFTKLRIIWDEIENFRPNPTCACETNCSCYCDVMTLLNQRKLEDQATQFLRGLNEQYHNIKSHVLLMEPIPPISKIFSLVVQQEHELASNTLVTNNINSVVSNISVNRNPSFASITCNFYGKIGHTEKVCFRKNGFPNKDNRKYKNNNNKKICTHCGINGHIVKNCYKKHGYPPGYKFFNGGKHSQINSIVSIDDVSSEKCQKGQEEGKITSLLCSTRFFQTFSSKVEVVLMTTTWLIQHK